jgi:YD repeat-containing protein
LFNNDRFALRSLNQWFVAEAPQGSLDDRFPAVSNPTSYTARVPYRPVVSDPVDTATGALVASAVDLSAPAGASMLEWSRSYNSLRTAPSQFGPGWTHNWTDRIDATGSAPVFVASDGRTFEFADDGSGSLVRPDELLADLTASVDGFELAWFSGEVWTFDNDGQLTTRTDWSGQTVDIVRNGDGTIAQLTASTGPAITFTYTVDGLLESASMSDGRTATYSYTGGVLSGVVNPDRTTTYTHDTEDRIVSETDTTGVVVHTTEFSDAGRVIRQVLAHGEETLFSYDDSVPSTTVIDVTSGDAVTYTFDATARLVSITDPAGNTTFTEWNGDGQPTGSTDRLGHNPSATYDANGNLTSVTDPVRGTTSYTYDTLNRVTSVTEPTGAVTTMTYESNERLPSTVTDALGAVTIFDVVGGLVVSVADADGDHRLRLRRPAAHGRHDQRARQHLDVHLRRRRPPDLDDHTVGVCDVANVRRRRQGPDLNRRRRRCHYLQLRR